MPEHEQHLIEQTPQKPKTMAEHRAEFTQKYEDILTGEAKWVTEDGTEIEGRVYEFTGQSHFKHINNIGQFRLKARQAGFQVVDRIEFPNADFGSGPTVHTVRQFHLEGRSLPQGQITQASQTAK